MANIFKCQQLVIPIETTLWTNSSPTSSFATQTVTLSNGISNYSYIKIVYRASNTVEEESYLYVPQAKMISSTETNDYNIVGLCNYGTSYRYIRFAFYASDTSIKFSDCGRWKNNANGNTICVPISIIGVNVMAYPINSVSGNGNDWLKFSPYTGSSTYPWAKGTNNYTLSKASFGVPSTKTVSKILSVGYANSSKTSGNSWAIFYDKDVSTTQYLSTNNTTSAGSRGTMTYPAVSGGVLGFSENGDTLVISRYESSTDSRWVDIYVIFE